MYSEEVSNEGCFQSSGNSSHGLGGEFLTLQGLYQNAHGNLSSSGRVVPAVQVHYNESRGYPGAEVEEESPCSAPVALDLSDPRSWKTQSQDVLPLGF